MADRTLLETFEQDLTMLLGQLEAITGENDPLWNHAFALKRRAWHLRVGDKRMWSLHRKLGDLNSLLLGQAIQRRKLLQELRSIEISN